MKINRQQLIKKLNKFTDKIDNVTEVDIDIKGASFYDGHWNCNECSLCIECGDCKCKDKDYNVSLKMKVENKTK